MDDHDEDFISSNSTSTSTSASAQQQKGNSRSPGANEEEEEEFDVAKEGIAFDGEMFLAAAVRISAKMHLELDVQMALAHKQGQDHQQQNQAGGKPALTPVKVAETLDRARVVSGYKIECSFVWISYHVRFLL